MDTEKDTPKDFDFTKRTLGLQLIEESGFNLLQVMPHYRVAELLKVTPTTVLNWTRGGKIDCYQVSDRKWLIPFQDVLFVREAKRRNLW